MSTPHDYLPIVLQAIAALGFVGITMFATHRIGPKRASDAKLEPFESGLQAVGNARTPFSIKYFFRNKFRINIRCFYNKICII